jgi:hypothetical protein
MNNLKRLTNLGRDDGVIKTLSADFDLDEEYILKKLK